MGENSAAQLIKRFKFLQQERTESHMMFDEGHKAYLASAPDYNFQMYRQLVHEITQTFKNISDEILTLQQRLKTDFDCAEAANLIEKVQEDEKLKLEMTVKLQIAEQNVIDKKDADIAEQEVQNTKDSITEVTSRINEHLEDLKYETEDLVT